MAGPQYEVKVRYILVMSNMYRTLFFMTFYNLGLDKLAFLLSVSTMILFYPLCNFIPKGIYVYIMRSFFLIHFKSLHQFIMLLNKSILPIKKCLSIVFIKLFIRNKKIGNCAFITITCFSLLLSTLYFLKFH
ncbi:hypothetical protein CN335_31255 [Bacillus thuringiensis]|nr:hypothetical protein CN335_31255 [Bacillus thuringiensis]PFT11070.1 hypothetical protein COK83_22405 [Bacillus thuringiensis]PGK34746.1 hypothetical protein CN908_26715 [Bacillus thuringiensis]